MIQENVEIISNKIVAEGFYRLTIRSHRIAKDAKPGQFVQIKVTDGPEPLLRRPISIHGLDDRDAVAFLYQVRGVGTAALAGRKAGERLDVIGPIGRGFTVDSRYKRAILTAGGIGVAPLMFLAQQYRAKGSEVTVLIGARSKDLLLCSPDFKKLGCRVMTVTDDGSGGEKGFVTDLLEPALTGGKGLAAVFACGPRQMMKRSSVIAGLYDMECEVSMEERMACGIGACLGCAVMTSDGYRRVCADGPVFKARDIIWTD
jgi:dihydroorotate dehydrogenase electron transfer subunit